MRPRYYRNLKQSNGSRLNVGLVLLAPIALFLVCLAMAFGCGAVTRKPALTTLECRVALLEPYLGTLTPEVVRDALANGPAGLIRALLSLGLTPVEVQTIGKAWHDCSPTLPSMPSAPSDAGPSVVRVESN